MAAKEVKPKLKIYGYHQFYKDGKLLYCEKYGLSGKPDFIFKRHNKYIPVELKSGKLKGAGKPRLGDLMQLVAYFFIIHSEFGKMPRQGRLIYGDTMFIVKNRRRLRKQFLGILSEMKSVLEYGCEFDDVEQSFSKCKYCICRETVCE